MTRTTTRIIAALAAIGLGAGRAAAQSTEAINPTARSVTEGQLLDALKFGDTIRGRITIPNQSAADLEKPTNKVWMWLNLEVIDWVIIAAVLVTLAVVVIFYLRIGRLEIDKGRSGRTITRFNIFERVMHWTMASSFVVLALSGLNVAIGRYVVQPWLGEAAFGTATHWGKLAHNYLAWPFMLCVVLTFLVWVRHNMPSRLDIAWFKAGGGLLKNGAHPPATKFNAGQKVVFWAVVLGGSAVAVTGLALMFPYLLGSPLQWQAAQVVHALAAAGLIAMTIGHIYIATAGSEGALEAMTTGEVDVNWAEQHHSLWLKEEMAKGTTPRTPPTGATPAE
ncbi:formate dehydrogenase subunit gamma [Gemmobacter nectariphilus]|uniref:formate dehydrogenase subunit gamma n=1 Tax=Gemmobacter nectariphilus TaxID=220343 RepID=UPI000409DDC2|nr:formate dehydrogenase subunit gamma [Gemmobacter nectariphilus]